MVTHPLTSAKPKEYPTTGIIRLPPLGEGSEPGGAQDSSHHPGVDSIKFYDKPISNEGGVTYDDATDDVVSDSQAPPPEVSIADEVNKTLRSMLSRPVNVFHFQWDVGNLSFSTDIIQAWISLNLVQRKLANAYIFRSGGYHVRIVTNGSPYQYGCYGVGFWPNIVSDPIVTAAAMADPTKISTLPFFDMVDPSTNSIIEWDIPDLRPFDTTTTTPFSGFGNLVGLALSGLAWTTGSSQWVDFQVFVNPINPQLHGLTHTNPYYGTSDFKPSGVLKTLKRVASTMSSAPLIGKFATTFGTAAGVAADVAALLGYTRPTVLDPPTFVTPRSTTQCARLDGEDPLEVLGEIPSAVTSIDPQLLGLPRDDQMSYEFILRRWSLVQGVNIVWNSTDAVYTSTYIWSNSPRLGNTATPAYCMTNLSYISAIHTLWTGSIEYKLRFCCSAFHTGRIEIVVDEDPFSVAATSDPTSVSQSIIVDLAQQREVVFSVPYSYPTPWRPTGTNACWTASSHIASSVTAKIYLRVLSALRAGTSAATSINVLLFNRAGPDFQLAGPSFIGWRDASNEVNLYPSATTVAIPGSSYQYFGTSDWVDESVTTPAVSLRAYLNRWQLTRYMSFPGSSGTCIYQCVRDMPCLPGTVSNNMGQYYIQRANWNFFSYFIRAYAGYRGSVKTRLLPTWSEASVSMVFRSPREDVADNMTGSQPYSAQRLDFFDSGAGAAIYTNKYGGDTSFNYKNQWISSNYYKPSFTADSIITPGSGTVLFKEIPTGLSGQSDHFTVWNAAGEDFQFVWYCGPPMMYTYSIA